MRFFADFHIHSKYSRATSKEMDLENLDKWARIKGIQLLGTGDFTHPGWLKELKSKLQVLDSDEDRQIIELKFFDGLSHNEIAEVVGKSSGNVRVILHRALKKLKEIYKK